MPGYLVGFDIGGTKCAAVLARTEYGVELIDRLEFETQAQRGFEYAKEQLLGAGRALLERNHLPRTALLGIGVSCGGPLDSRKGMVLSPPHLPGWDEIPLTDILREEFGAPAFLQNDANACALVEWQLGAGRGTQDMIFLTMGTGFGAGIIAQGTLLEGATGLAGEIGHVRLESDGPLIYGKPGSVEGFCGGAGIAALAREWTRLLQTQGRPPAWQRNGIPLDDLDARLLCRYAQQNDPDALELWRRVGEQLGKALAVLIDLFNPELIAIGSIFMRAEAYLRPAMEAALEREALPGARAQCRIVPAQKGEQLGDYASVLTACHALGLPVAPAAPPPERVVAHARLLLQRYPTLAQIEKPLYGAYDALHETFARGGKLLICGNGGSAADAEHIVGELMKGFLLSRPLPADQQVALGQTGMRLQRALPAIALTQHAAFQTAFSNDADPALTFAQQVYGYGRAGDALLCISTSGNARNVLEAAKVARALRMRVIALTGESGGALHALSDIALCVPERETFRVQELHLPVYHAICAMLEAGAFGGGEGW